MSDNPICDDAAEAGASVCQEADRAGEAARTRAHHSRLIDGEPAIVVLSTLPAWVELLVSCGHDLADRIQSYIVNLDVELPTDVRETTGFVFRELLLDAMEWDGHLDPSRKVRIAYMRGRKMLLYRIADAGSGFRAGDRPAKVPRATIASLGGLEPSGSRRDSSTRRATKWS